MENGRRWVGTWASAPAPSEAGLGFNNHTLRMNPRVSIGGDTIRVRVSNAYGNGKLPIGEQIAQTNAFSGVKAGSAQLILCMIPRAR